MKSLYNKSGILPALFMNSRVDCGIAWSEHRKVERVKREDIIQVEAPDLSAYLKGTIDGCIFKLRSQYAELSMISAKAGVALKEIDLHEETLKPIDPQTIKVGDTVRLVGSRTITEWPNCCLDVGEDYKVKAVDRESEDGLTVGFFLTEFSKPFWIYDEDLMLVEPA